MKANQHALTVIILFCLATASQGAFNLTLLHTADTLSTVTAADEYGNACQPVNDSTFSYVSFSGVNCYGGAARMRTLIERESARSDHVFLVDSGASLAFSLYFYLYGSPLIADYFGLLGYDAVAWQVADLQSQLDVGAFMLRAHDNNSSMQFVCSNIQGFDAPAGTALSRYATKTFANTSGHEVGYISTLAANLASMIRGLNVSATDEAQALREGLAALVNKGVNKVVAAVSSNATAELVLASVPGIDILIVPGQLQSNNNGSGFLASRVGPYPVVYDTDWGQPVLVVSSGTFGRLMGVLNVEFDDHGVITAWMGDSVLMDDSVPADPALHAQLLTLDQSVQARFQQVVGWTAVNLSFDNQCIHGECGIGDWLSDSYRDFASGSLGFRVQLGLANGGAVRGGIRAGPVTLGQLQQTIPFGSNEVYALRILGLYVLDALENGLSLATNTTTELMSGAGRFLFPSGLRFSWNPTEPPGLRVVDAYVEVQQGVWQLLLPNESYTLATDRWLADGGDGFTMIPQYSTERYPTGGIVNEVLFQAFSRNVTGLQTGRITMTTAASRRTCLAADGSTCSGNGYCQTGVCHCTVGGASGRLCTTRPAQASSSSADQAVAIALGVALPLLFVVVLVAVVVCALLVRAKKRESDSCWEIDTSELDMGQQLGAGGFGQVHQAVWKGTDVAVKVVPVGEDQQQVKAVCQTFKHEVRVMRELRHPNVVLFMAACTKPPRLCIVMELMELGSLYDAAFHAARGMHFLHSSGIVHRDLKSLNLLLDSKWNLKVSDFGLTRLRTDLKMAIGSFKAHGTIHWAAPEIMKESPNIDYSLADVYAFGVVLWELLTREAPYGGMSLAAIAVGVLRDDLRPAPLDEIPTAQRFEPLEAIMVECWDRDPAMRPSFHEVMTRIAAISPKTDDAAVSSRRPTTTTPSSSSSSSSSSTEPSLSSSRSWGLDSLAAPATDVDVTVAFSDVADAAGLWDSNPRDMRGAMEHHNQLLRKLLATHHGYESRFMQQQQQQQQQQQHMDNGEGYFCMVFADPTDALQWHPPPPFENDQPARGHATTAHVRFGVHKGSAIRHRDPVSGRRGYGGAAVDVAMALTQHAEGGQVLVSDSVVAAIVAQHPKADFELRFRTVGVVPVEPHDSLNSADRAQAVGAFDMRPHAECPTYEHERESVERCAPGRRLERIAIGSGNACKYIVNYEDLTLSDQPVGEGGYGWVYRGRWHGVEVAVKRPARKRFDEDSRLQFREEASLLARLRHPHVVLFIGVCLRPPNVCIVTEWMPRGSLRDVLDDQTHELDWPLRLSLVRGVALGLAYIHSFTPAILHLDLNSSNVLIDDLWNAKIADFALAQMKRENATTMPWCVTPAWTAPEIVRRESYTERADVFSLGIIMWEVATRELPFAGDQNARVALHIVEGKRPSIPANMPPGYADLMQACWHEEALQRPSAEQAAHMLEPLVDDEELARFF